jgi:hypothetical protein
MARVVVWTLALTLGASQAIAQSARPPLEVGLGFSGVAISPYVHSDLLASQAPAAEIRVTAPFSPRLSIEGRVSAPSHGTGDWSGVLGYYTIQVKQRIVRSTRDDFHHFVTYGATGFWYQRPRRDRPTYYAAGFCAIGAGLQQELGSHAALRADAQLLTALWIPLGVRFAADISIPLGRYD